MTSIVFGGSGIVGGYIVDQLVRAGESVVAVSRQDRQTPDVEWVIGDLSNPAGLKLTAPRHLACGFRNYKTTVSRRQRRDGITDADGYGVR
jgi:uncharacterized protein YbjT (DUF2867 family)